MSLIAADNLLWRLAGWIASHAFVGVTGDLRSELFRHLTGHAPSYFAQRLPGTLTGRITATSNAAFAVENFSSGTFCRLALATVVRHRLLAVVSVPMAAALAAIAALVMLLLFRLAARGAPLHHGFADQAAAVEGELADVIGNMPLVRTFGAIGREHSRFDRTVGREMTARRRSLQYLERLRLLHAVLTIVLTVAVLAWAIVLWQRGQASAGDVVLVCTLGFTVLHATRDLAVALVDVTQHMARLAEAHRDPAAAARAARASQGGAAGARREGTSRRAFENVSFGYPGGRKVFEDFSLRHRRRPAHRPGRPLGQRQVDGAGPAAALPRPRSRAHPDRRPGHRPHHPGEPARAPSPSCRRTSRCCTARSWRTSATAGPRRRDREVMAAAEAARCRLHRGAAQRLSTPSSATAARGCRAASASASPSPARS